MVLSRTTSGERLEHQHKHSLPHSHLSHVLLLLLSLLRLHLPLPLVLLSLLPNHLLQYNHLQLRRPQHDLALSHVP